MFMNQHHGPVATVRLSLQRGRKSVLEETQGRDFRPEKTAQLRAMADLANAGVSSSEDFSLALGARLES